ncbi:MAG: NlpC/P60 family protein [Nocardioidaceae bacterium]
MTDDRLAVSVPIATVWTSPHAPRKADADAVADHPDVAAWTDTLDTEERLGLHGRTLTQALLGEPLEVVGEREHWLEVVLPWQPSSSSIHGYRGWVRSTHVGPAAADSETRVVVVAPSAVLHTDFGPMPVSYGTILPLLRADDEVLHVATPAGTAQVRRDDATVRHQPADPLDTGWMLHSARQFLGLRYMWGGTSGWGFDCSGLVHLVHRAAGVTLPRDAFDQAAAVPEVPLDDADPGDLYFFAQPGGRVFHVGFATSGPPHDPRRMLHAPETGDLLEEAPMARRRSATLVSAGRAGELAVPGADR